MAHDIEPGRQTVFIAYARHDQAFADHLAEGMAKDAQAVLQTDELEAFSDRGLYEAAGEADDLGREGGRSLRQTRLCPSS
jgi:hypothetical protein